MPSKEEAIGEALQAGDIPLAARLAAELPTPAAHLKAMLRIFEASKQQSLSTPTKDDMQIELLKQRAQLANLSTNVELHGDDPQPVAYLKLAVSLTINDLAMFGATMRDSMYEKGDAPKLRVHELKGPFDVEGKIVGATVTIHRGLDHKSDIKLPGCTVDSYKIDPADGGGVTFECKVACHPDRKQIGELFFMQKESVEISIEPAQSELSLDPSKADAERPRAH